MTQFKPGDKVRCVNDDDELLKEGEIYIVTETRMNSIYPQVMVCGIPDEWWDSSRFVPAEPATADSGPQRATPASVAQVQAQAKQAASQLEATTKAGQEAGAVEEWPGDWPLDAIRRIEEADENLKENIHRFADIIARKDATILRLREALKSCEKLGNSIIEAIDFPSDASHVLSRARAIIRAAADALAEKQ